MRIMPRVGNSLFGFLSESLVFCERKSEIVNPSFPKNKSLFCSFIKSDGSNLLLGIKREKAVKNCQNMLTSLFFKEG